MSLRPRHRTVEGGQIARLSLYGSDAVLGFATGDLQMTLLGIELDLLTPAERRDLANALLRAAWNAALADTRILLLDLLLEVDDTVVGG